MAWHKANPPFKHPELRAGIQSETAALFAGSDPTPGQLRQADVLHRAALETLRRYPTTPAVQRTVIEPFEFAGYRVDAGKRLFIGATVVHFDEQYHPYPERFDIERYTAPRAEHRIPGAFAPYGMGAHTPAWAPDWPRRRSC